MIHTLLLGADGRLQWETLLTGILALVAAGWTVNRLNAQIRQADRLAADQRRRRERAARAVLPLALSELVDYAKACMVGLDALRPCFRPDGSLDRSEASKLSATWTMPTLPESVLPVIKECIEFAEDQPAEMLIALVRRLQVHRARLDDDISRLRLNDGIHLLLWPHIQQAIRDAAEIYARASSVFTFARGGSPQQLEASHVRMALFAAGRFDSPEIETMTNDWLREFQARKEVA